MGDSRGDLSTGPEPMWIQGDPNCHCGPQSKQIMWTSSSQQAHARLKGPQTHPGAAPGSGSTGRRNHPRREQNPRSGFLTGRTGTDGAIMASSCLSLPK